MRRKTYWTYSILNKMTVLLAENDTVEVDIDGSEEEDGRPFWEAEPA